MLWILSNITYSDDVISFSANNEAGCDEKLLFYVTIFSLESTELQGEEVKLYLHLV